jgi:hypothetical protein
MKLEDPPRLCNGTGRGTAKGGFDSHHFILENITRALTFKRRAV